MYLAKRSKTNRGPTYSKYN